MELSFVAPGTRTPRYALKLAGLPETVEPIDPAWIDDALTAALRVFEAHRVHFADAYFAYRARETSHETVGRSAAAGIGAMQPAGDLLDDTPLLADTFAIAQLAALVSLEATGLTDIIDVRLVVERLRDNAPAAPDPGPGDITLSPTSSPSRAARAGRADGRPLPRGHCRASCGAPPPRGTVRARPCAALPLRRNSPAGHGSVICDAHAGGAAPSPAHKRPRVRLKLCPATPYMTAGALAQPPRRTMIELQPLDIPLAAPCPGPCWSRMGNCSSPRAT